MTKARRWSLIKAVGCTVASLYFMVATFAPGESLQDLIVSQLFMYYFGFRAGFNYVEG